jgi:hypothetical protein
MQRCGGHCRSKELLLVSTWDFVIDLCCWTKVDDRVVRSGRVRRRLTLGLEKMGALCKVEIAKVATVVISGVFFGSKIVLLNSSVRNTPAQDVSKEEKHF